MVEALKKDTPGKHHSWITVYPAVMSSLNSAITQRGTDQVSSYELVFGMKFNHPIYTQEESRLRQLTSAKQRVEVLGRAYKEKMIFHGLIGSKHNEADDAMGNAGDDKEDTESETESPAKPSSTLKAPSVLDSETDSETGRTAKPASTLKAPSVLDSETDSETERTAKPASTLKAPSVLDSETDSETESTEKPAVLDSDSASENETASDSSDRKRKLKSSKTYSRRTKLKSAGSDRTTDKVVQRKRDGNFVQRCIREKIDLVEIKKQFGSGQERQVSDITFRCHFPRLECEECCFNEVLVTAFDPGYYKACMETQRWFEQDFVTSFTLLMAHISHNPTVQVLISNYEKETLHSSQLRSLRTSIESVLSIVLNGSHFAVVHVKVRDSIVEVMDGLTKGTNVSRWHPHIERILKRTKLIPPDATGAEGKFGNFKVNHEELVQQNDSHNCGPIACGTVWSIIGKNHFNVKEYNGASLRRMVVEKYMDMVKSCEKELKVSRKIIRSFKVPSKSDEAVTEIKTDESDICCFCYDNNDNTSLQLQQCKHRFHCACLFDWLDYNNCCPICKDKVDAEEVGVLLDGLVVGVPISDPPCTEVTTSNPPCSKDNRETLILSPPHSKLRAMATNDHSTIGAQEVISLLDSPPINNRKARILSPPRPKRASLMAMVWDPVNNTTSMQAAKSDSTSDHSVADSVNHRKAKLANDMAIATRRQKKQAEQMKKQHAASLNVEIGSIVCLKVDIRDRSRCNSTGIIAVAFNVSKNTGGFRAVCEHGVIGSGKKEYWVSYEKFSILDKNQTLSPGLQKIKQEVIGGMKRIMRTFLWPKHINCPSTTRKPAQGSANVSMKHVVQTADVGEITRSAVFRVDAVENANGRNK